MQFVQRNYTGVYQCEVSFDNETLIATGYVYVQGTFCVFTSETLDASSRKHASVLVPGFKS